MKNRNRFGCVSYAFFACVYLPLAIRTMDENQHKMESERRVNFALYKCTREHANGLYGDKCIVVGEV